MTTKRINIKGLLVTGAVIISACGLIACGDAGNTNKNETTIVQESTTVTTSQSTTKSSVKEEQSTTTKSAQPTTRESASTNSSVKESTTSTNKNSSATTTVANKENNTMNVVVSDAKAAAIIKEAQANIGKPYASAGIDPAVGFDASGLTSYCYGKSGIKLERSSQGQYDMCKKINANEAKPGDLVFFTKTYESSNYITSVGIYIGNNSMITVGDKVKISDLNGDYNKAHFVGFGRVPGLNQ